MKSIGELQSFAVTVFSRFRGLRKGDTSGPVAYIKDTLDMMETTPVNRDHLARLMIGVLVLSSGAGCSPEGLKESVEDRLKLDSMVMGAKLKQEVK